MTWWIDPTACQDFSASRKSQVSSSSCEETPSASSTKHLRIIETMDRSAIDVADPKKGSVTNLGDLEPKRAVTFHQNGSLWSWLVVFHTVTRCRTLVSAVEVWGGNSKNYRCCLHFSKPSKLSDLKAPQSYWHHSYYSNIWGFPEIGVPPNQFALFKAFQAFRLEGPSILLASLLLFQHMGVS